MISLFIKSYEKDYKWLKHCLYSIKKFVTGYDEVFLIIEDKNDFDMLMCWELPSRIRIRFERKIGDGYIFQQYIKMNAHRYIDAEKILYLDSDCIFTKATDLSLLSGKPEMLYTPYDMVGDAICWKECTEKVMKQPIEYEFMRRNGLIYYRSTLVNFEKFIGDLKSILNESRFSEFNALRAFAFIHENNKYKWIDTTKDKFGEALVEQMWSWGNIEDYQHIIQKIYDNN